MTQQPARPPRARVPGYVWTLVSLVAGVLLGGSFPDALGPVATGVGALIEAVIFFVPLLILLALAPAVATLARTSRAGRFSLSLVGWYLLTSVLAGLLGLGAGGLLFRIPWSLEGGGGWPDVATMLSTFGEVGGATAPLLSIVVAVVLGLVASRQPRLGSVLDRVRGGFGRAGRWIALVMIPLVFALGASVGVRFGARVGLESYLLMTGYTALLCLVWTGAYLVFGVRWLGGRRLPPVLKQYYVPTATVAAGTCSSLATLPVNLVNAEAVGVRPHVAGFILPFGAVVNLDASALAYTAYAPFVMTVVFDLPISWALLLIAWPAMVAFTIAAPGLPAGMGTALWSATLFSSMLELEGSAQADFVGTWLALSGGLPDMFRTATNCTGDGFTALIFDRWFGGESGGPGAGAPPGARA